MAIESKVIIVGAGPAGLAVAGCLCHNGFTDYLIIDQADQIGQSWRNHYDRLHLHTVKRLSHLPHLPFPDNYPTYASRSQVVQYLESYAKHMNINPILSQEVHAIYKVEDRWEVKTTTDTYVSDSIVIATGTNRIPHEPSWPGQETFTGQLVHSRAYKNPGSMIGQKILIIGMGNTGSEIALDLANAGKEVVLSVRSPISLVPRDLNGKPVQETAKTLAKIPFGLGDWLGSQIRKIYFGDVSKYGLEISKMHPTVQLRETGKTPVIDLGTIEAIKQGKIKIVKDISSIGKQEVTTIDGKEVQVDSILLATGYRARIETFMPEVSTHLNEHGLPKDPIGHGNLEGSYYIGFDNYKLGGILGTIRNDSQLIVEDLVTSLRK